MEEQEKPSQQKSTTENQGKGLTFKQKFSLTVSVLLGVGLVAFVVQNYNAVKIEFFMFDFRVRIVYLMLFSAITGGLLTYALGKYRKSKKKK